MSTSNKKEVYETVRKAVIIGETFTKMLHPISSDIPELLLPICGIPIIEYYIDVLTTGNVKEIIICVKHHLNVVKQYIKTHHKKNVNIKVLENPGFNSVGDCLRKVNSEKLISGDFILIRGLVLFNIDIEDMFKVHQENKQKDKNCMMTSLFKNFKNISNVKTDYDDNLLIYHTETKRIYQYEGTYLKGRMKLNENISFMPGKDGVVPKYSIRSDLYDAGIDICGAEMLNIFTENFDYHSIRNDFYKNMLVSEIYTDTFYLYEVSRDEYLGLIRNPESYLKVSFEILNKWAHPLVVEELLISQKLNINLKAIDFSIYNDKDNKEENYSKANLVNSVLMSKNCFIDEKTTVNFTVLDHDVKIGKNCVLENVIIFPHVTIEDGVEIKNSIISSGVIVSTGISIENSIIGKDITQDTDASNERIYNSFDPDTNETMLERDDKDIFFKNLEDRDAMFLCVKSTFNPNEVEEEEDESNSEDDEEESVESEEASEEEDYENDLVNVINNGLAKNLSIDQMIKEIGGLKNAFWEKTYSETIKACLSPILTHFMKGESFNHTHIEKIKDVFITWMPLFKRLVPNDEVEVQLISVFEKLCMDIPEISEAFHIIIQVLNGDELNVIKDQAIKEWNDLEVSEYPYSDGKVSIPSSIHKSNLDKMQKYIEMNIKS